MARRGDDASRRMRGRRKAPGERRPLGTAKQSERCQGGSGLQTAREKGDTEDYEEKGDPGGCKGQGEPRECKGGLETARERGYPGECEEGGDSEAGLREPARGSVSAGETGGPRGEGEEEGGEGEKPEGGEPRAH